MTAPTKSSRQIEFRAENGASRIERPITSVSTLRLLPLLTSRRRDDLAWLHTAVRRCGLVRQNRSVE